MYDYQGYRQRGEAPRTRIRLNNPPAFRGREFYSKSYAAQQRENNPRYPRRWENRDPGYRDFQQNAHRVWNGSALFNTRTQTTLPHRGSRNTGRGGRRLPTIFDFVQKEINTRYDKSTEYDNTYTGRDNRYTELDPINTNRDLRYNNTNRTNNRQRESLQIFPEDDYRDKIYDRFDERDTMLRRPDRLVLQLNQTKKKNNNKKNRKGRNKNKNTVGILMEPEYPQQERASSRFDRNISENLTRSNLNRFNNQQRYGADTDRFYQYTNTNDQHAYSTGDRFRPDQYTEYDDQDSEPLDHRPNIRARRDVCYGSARPTAGVSRAPMATENRSPRDTNTNMTYNKDSHNTYNIQRDRGNRFLPRNTRGGGRQKDSNIDRNPDYTPPSPRLKLTMKLMYELIRAVHHLQNVTTKIKDNTPTGFRKMTQFLIDTIKPAAPSKKTEELLEGNARNWLHNTQLILEEHYETHIHEILSELEERTNQADWRQAFEVASNWARKNFRERLNEEVLEKVEALYVVQMNTEAQTHTDTNRQTETVVQQTTRQERLTVDTQTSPLNVPDPSRTPTRRGEWSFDAEENPPEEPRPLTPTSTPARHQEPLEQRTRRRCATEVLVELETLNEPEQETVVEDGAQMGAVNPNAERLERVFNRAEDAIVIDDNVTPQKHTEKRKNTDDRPLISKLSLTRLTAPPFLFSEDSEDSEGAPVPCSAFSWFLKEGQRIIEEGSEADSEAEDQVTHILNRALPEKEKTVNTANRHINTTRKNQDWSLTLKNKYVIIGDSNVSKMRNFSYVNLQIDSFPGAKFQHAGNLIEKATIIVQPEMVIFSFGINNRTQRCVQNTTKEIQRTYKMARNRLPNARLYFPVINYSELLVWEERTHLDGVNEYIRETLMYIEKLPHDRFKVEQDLLHWTTETAKAILEHWAHQLNWPGPSGK